MSKCLINLLYKCLLLICPPLCRSCTEPCNRQPGHLKFITFLWGFGLGQIYNYYLLSRIPLPEQIRAILSTILSLILGICCATSIQIRCISLLMYPTFCGKTGRGVLKVVVLTYVVAGPITNMGTNAREVVRVFACSTQLSYNLSKEEHSLLAERFRKTALSLRSEMEQIKDTLRSMNDVVGPIENEVKDNVEVRVKQEENDYIDKLLGFAPRSELIEKKFQNLTKSQPMIKIKRDVAKQHQIGTFYQNLYGKKLTYRCENQVTQALATCIKAFNDVYRTCLDSMPVEDENICQPLKIENVCKIMPAIDTNGICDGRMQMDPGFGEGYLALERAKHELTKNLQNIKLQYQVTYERNVYDIQDAKETGERVMQAFKEKTSVMGIVITALNVYVAFLCLRIAAAAVGYHDKYLTKIEYDNVYITSYFRLLDKRRHRRGEITLLPLKKMERLKYIDLSSMSYRACENSVLFTQVLKVMLEMVTATTFVMLDRMFYEALDVVRQHAQIDNVQQDLSNLKIEVEGTSMLAALFRRLLFNLSTQSSVHRTFTNQECLPQPKAMPFYYYFKIYGGYLWILLLLHIDPYTTRLSRLTCSYCYPRREKQRILHLYNDILKKRMKMQKTLCRKAVQVVRAHYLSGENLLSLRMKFPYALGWLRVFPAARMSCLICGETQPRTDMASQEAGWRCCREQNCPFVSCNECWREAGARCLACDPSLVELSDIDSLSGDEDPKY